MATRRIGWIQQVGDQYLAVRTADFGGKTSYHSKFGDAKTAVESSVGRLCRAHKEDIVPTRWEILDTVSLPPIVAITSPAQGAVLVFPSTVDITFTSQYATTFEAFGSFNGGAFVSLGTGDSPIPYDLVLADVGTFEFYVVATGPDGVTTSAHVSGTVLNGT